MLGRLAGDSLCGDEIPLPGEPQQAGRIARKASPGRAGLAGRNCCVLDDVFVECKAVDFFAFDEAYVERLRNGDPATELHFFVYFEKLLQIKLRARAIGSDNVQDLKQDTFTRVMAALRKQGGVRQPERIGAFVASTCNNVLLEYYRTLRRNQQMDETHQAIPDKVLDLEGMMVSKQSSERVRRILSALPARDRDLLRAVFLEEKDKDAVCWEIGVDRDYLRVLLYRARNKFKAVYEKDQFGALPQVTGFGNSQNDFLMEESSVTEV